MLQSNFNLTTIWVYWSTNGPADSDLSVGALIDVTTSTPGIIEFTAAETFDYTLLVGNAQFGTRWMNEGVGPALGVSPDFIDQ